MMKPIRFSTLLVLGLTLVLTGCHMNPQNPLTIRGPKVKPIVQDENAPPIKSGPEITGNNPMIELNPVGSHSNWVENADMFKADAVHFALDSSAVKSSEKSHVAAVADYLKSNSSHAVRVEGHCDERGTEEYNRSLGERRAIALREALIALGIEPSRVDTLSYGEDRPIESGHSETVWAKNRRGEFILLTPPAQTEPSTTATPAPEAAPVAAPAQ
jgi:peptidoglycan-associated lipoprotein